MNIPFNERRPAVDPEAWIAPNATLVGAATIAAGCGIWFGSVIRADEDDISVGRDSNVQDNCVLHADPGFPVRIGERVSVGHGAIIHGCVIEDDVLIGMGATLMNGVVVGAGSLIAAGALLTEGTVVPPDTLVAGVPAKIRRSITTQERTAIEKNAEDYARRMLAYR